MRRLQARAAFQEKDLARSVTMRALHPATLEGIDRAFRGVIDRPMTIRPGGDAYIFGRLFGMLASLPEPALHPMEVLLDRHHAAISAQLSAAREATDRRAFDPEVFLGEIDPDGMDAMVADYARRRRGG